MLSDNTPVTVWESGVDAAPSGSLNGTHYVATQDNLSQSGKWSIVETGEQVQCKRVSRKRLLGNLGMREFRLAPGGERVAVVRNNVVGVAERPKPDGEDFSGADIIVQNGDTIARLSLLETYPTVIEVLGK